MKFYVRYKFVQKRVANPIKLFYNDYNAVAPYKRGRIVSMLRNLIEEGVPIDGMGIQGHWGVDSPSLKEIEDALKMYEELGLEIHITELDIGMGDFTEEEQAERYRELFQLFKKYSHVITSVTLWGLADDASWRGDDNPLLFDRNHEPKPAFWALVDTDKPWYVNKAEYTGAVIFKNDRGERVGSLKPGQYALADLDFALEDAVAVEVAKGHYLSFYASENLEGDAWHFISTDQFDGMDLAQKAKSLSVRYIPAENVALNKPVEANVRDDRAHRAVDGDKLSSWSPNDTPPYWITVDLEQPYLLNRWVCKLQGTGPLAGIAESPFNAADFKLQVSSDGTNWVDADIVEGNTASTTDRPLNLVEARYVRLYVTRPTSLETNKNLVLYELELYGFPIE